MGTPKGRKREKQMQEKERTGLLRMEFRTFVNAFIRLPCQIVRTGRKYETENRDQEISGDLARMLDESQPAREQVAHQ